MMVDACREAATWALILQWRPARLRAHACRRTPSRQNPAGVSAEYTPMAHVADAEAGVLDAAPMGSRRRFAARISPVFARLVEIPAALLVVAEIVVLLA